MTVSAIISGDILDEVETHEKLCSKGLTMDCIGGGRIRHEKNKLHVYGYSQVKILPI